MDASALEKVWNSFIDLLERSEKLDSARNYLIDEIFKIEMVGRDDEINYNWPWADPILKIQNVESMSASDGDAFLFFSSDKYKAHPWHQHSQIIHNISTGLNKTIASLHSFWKE